MDEFTTESFRETMSNEIQQFSTRKEFDAKTWDWLCSRLYYTHGKFDDLEAFDDLLGLQFRLGLGQLLEQRFALAGKVEVDQHLADGLGADAGGERVFAIFVLGGE